MKVEWLIKTLQELPKESEVFCLLYLSEDADLYAETELTKEEWAKIVEKMQNNDHVDTDVNEMFQYYVTQLIENRDKNANK